jgi:hypothetical protein
MPYILDLVSRLAMFSTAMFSTATIKLKCLQFPSRATPEGHGEAKGGDCFDIQWQSRD